MNDDVPSGTAAGNKGTGHSVDLSRLSRRAALRHIGLASGAGLLGLTRAGGILRAAAASQFANSGHALAGILADAPYQCDPRLGSTLSPDGKWWLVDWPNDWNSLGILPESMLISADGKASVPLPNLPGVSFWGNDSHTLYGMNWVDNPSEMLIWAADIRSPTEKRLLGSSYVHSLLSALCPSPDGRQLAFSWYDGSKPPSEHRLCLLNTVSGEKQLVPDVMCSGQFFGVQWPRASRYVFCQSQSSDDKASGLFIVDPDKAAVVDFVETPVSYFSASPRGNKIAVIYYDGITRPPNLNLITIRDTSGQIVFQTKKDSFSPRTLWSADGMRLFVSYMTFEKGSSIGMIDLRSGCFTDLVSYRDIGGRVAEVRDLYRNDLYFGTWPKGGLMKTLVEG